uniref:THAP-type domain-containing protein n=1 Tax=Parasteatoda tepidariorum TaxID=114398 RepID=A0A2L2YF12_PARTP
MTPTCCAYGCLNKFEKGKGLGFYRFPSQKNRRILWILAVRRKYFVPNKHTRICGAHFVTGKPSRHPAHPDYIPTLFKFKYSKHESKRFRKVLCDKGEVPVLDNNYESTSDSESEAQDFASDHGLESEIKIESEINSPSEIRIEDVQSILDNDEVHDPCSESGESSKLKHQPLSYTFLDIEGNVIARFVKKRVKKKPVRRSKPRPKRVDPDSVQIVIENNVARIVANV